MSGNPVRILVVDDEPPIRRFLRASLGSAGYDVLEAEDGKLALDMMRRNAVDLVVLDLGLPGALDGFAMIEGLRRSGSSVPVVVL